MKTAIRTSVLALAAMAMLTGCATQRTIYYNDGKLAHVVTCSEHAWYSCLEDAGKVCQNAGYKVVERHTGRSSVSLFSTGELIHDLVVECKAGAETEPVVAAVPAVTPAPPATPAAAPAVAPAPAAAETKTTPAAKPATGGLKTAPAAADSPWHM
ncbi:MAG TPA: hypothetical protein VMV91_07545 [Rhodocyclaceae bacterium]|nr:hypothetical protein [Rhodocyclaceae bacterium]